MPEAPRNGRAAAMILTALPDLPPRPETAANAAFRKHFYERWGRVNAVVCGAAASAEYAEHPQTLSFKRVRGGSERYRLSRRSVAVDDTSWLVLNEGARYGSVLEAAHPGARAFSFAVFLRPGLADEVAVERRRSLGAALDEPAGARLPVTFSEHLRAHDDVVGSRLDIIERAVLAGERSAAWLEEQGLRLVDALLDIEAHDHAPIEARGPRAAQRLELRRRLRLAADFIASEYTRELTLAEIAAAACLSRWHLVREFKRAFGATPHAWLMARRARAAQSLIDAGQEGREEIARSCGFGSRWAMRRALDARRKR